MRTSPRILLVEDDHALRESLALTLRTEGFEVEALPDGERLTETATRFVPHLAIFDVGLGPGPDGFALARRLRAEGDIPLLFLTAADAVEDRLEGFSIGADDYVTKPFSTAELLARIRALLRRTSEEDAERLVVADLVIDEAGRTAHRAGIDLDLTRTEFDVLVAFARNPGRVLSKTQLLSIVWGFEAYDTNLVEAYVSLLRKKLEANGERLIQTVRGVGYVLRAGSDR